MFFLNLLCQAGIAHTQFTDKWVLRKPLIQSNFATVKHTGGLALRTAIEYSHY